MKAGRSKSIVRKEPRQARAQATVGAILEATVQIGAQGNSECFQVVAHKNIDGFDRKIFLPRPAAAQCAA